MQTDGTVVDIQTARHREVIMQSAPAEQVQEGNNVSNINPNSGQAAVNDWVKRGFIALLALVVTILMSMSTWQMTTLGQIQQSTVALTTEFTAYKNQISELRLSVDSLRIRGESWATKDTVNATKDAILMQISDMRSKLGELESRVSRVEDRQK